MLSKSILKELMNGIGLREEVQAGEDKLGGRRLLSEVRVEALRNSTTEAGGRPICHRLDATIIGGSAREGQSKQCF